MPAASEPAMSPSASIPTLAMFKDGREIARQPGAMDLSGIVAWSRSRA